MIYGIVGNRLGWGKHYVFSQLKTLGISQIDTIVSGGAEGVDTYAQEFAKSIGCTMTIHYPSTKDPVPQRYFDRNKKIAEDCDILIAFDKVPAGRSGTANTIGHANRLGKPVKIYK